jgi:hypothetical protein
MPDGNQGPFTYRPPHPQTSTSPQAFNIPGATNPAGGVARAIAFVRGLSGKALVMGIVVVGLQAVMPEGRRPSDLIGGFHGDLDSAQMKATQKAKVEYDRAVTDATTAPPVNWQMEAEVSRQQQEVMARSLETMATAAQLADAACLGAPLVTMLMGDTLRRPRDSAHHARRLRRSRPDTR